MFSLNISFILVSLVFLVCSIIKLTEALTKQKNIEGKDSFKFLIGSYCFASLSSLITTTTIVLEIFTYISIILFLVSYVFLSFRSGCNVLRLWKDICILSIFQLFLILTFVFLWKHGKEIFINEMIEFLFWMHVISPAVLVGIIQSKYNKL